MRLSTRSTYGMRALVELALAGGRGPLSAAQIARRQELSVAYLEQLLHRLKKDGMVTSARGPRGGYALARSPREITMAQVVRILDGQNGSGNGKLRNGHRSPGRGTLARHAQRVAHAVLHCVHERLSESLSAVTLQDLCDEVRAQGGEPVDHRYVFHI